MRILIAAAEAAPLVKVGGLGDVAGVLPRELKALDPQGIDVRVILPFHQVLRQKDLKLDLLGEFPLATPEGDLPCQLYQYQDSELPIYLLANKYIDEAEAVYSGSPADDAMKYMSFSMAVLEAAKFLNWNFDVLLANDWHTALAVHLLKAKRKTDPFYQGAKTVLTIHNMPYNGWGSQAALRRLGIKPSWNKKLPAWSRYTPLAMGIAAADKVMAVSKGYADEILSEPFGSGLSTFMQTMGDRLTGIVNGIDTLSYDPMTDAKITANYSVNDLSGKAKCKRALQKLAGFEENPDTPLLTIVSRLDNQKGIGLALEGITKIADQPWQFVLLGTGAPELEALAADLAESHPERIASFIRFDDGLARQLYSGGDLFIMPSLYEPCGLSQMISMRYGNLPLAHAVGGLKDTITDYDDDPLNATGFLFYKPNATELAKRLSAALTLFQDKREWERLQLNAMQRDFSWQQSAREYLKLFKSLF